mgnify:CR=1 FL=1|jgi:hypothetical protein
MQRRTMYENRIYVDCWLHRGETNWFQIGIQARILHTNIIMALLFQVCEKWSAWNDHANLGRLPKRLLPSRVDTVFI